MKSIFFIIPILMLASCQRTSHQSKKFNPEIIGKYSADSTLIEDQIEIKHFDKHYSYNFKIIPVPSDGSAHNIIKIGADFKFKQPKAPYVFQSVTSGPSYSPTRRNFYINLHNQLYGIFTEETDAYLSVPNEHELVEKLLIKLINMIGDITSSERRTDLP